MRLTGRIFVLSLASNEPEYAVFVRAFSFGGQPTFARLERKIRPHKRLVFASMTVSKCREKPCGGDFSLHPQDSTLQVSKGYRHIFARPITASGTLHEAVYKSQTCVLSIRLTDSRQIIALDEQHKSIAPSLLNLSRKRSEYLTKSYQILTSLHSFDMSS